ncbi:tetratricopeptide repeat protein [Spirulina major]|uniref:tetratricopeptide repeat protein n=1 Tax=Spirulina major TaxID=270636 RepID=UPI000933D907|nr:tetratricopeptide repeat protein [Spirulina major]
MPKSYGPAPKSRAWELIEAILQFLDDGVKTPPERTPERLKVEWKRGNRLQVTTTLEDLAVLLYGKDWRQQPDKVKKNRQKELSERIRHYLGEFLEICDRHGGGPGVADWCITLQLWGQDLKTNQKGFDAAWQEKAPPKSPSRGRRTTVTVETEEFEPEASEEREPQLIFSEGLRAVPVWEGRDEVLARLAALVQGEGGPSVMVVAGQGGIGKTSLAVKLIEAVAAGFERVLFFRCQEGTTFDDLVGFLLGQGFGVDLAQLTTPGLQIGAVVQCLAQRCLVVVDNVESILAAEGHRAVSAELGRLLNAWVYQQHGSRVVLTSREVPADLGNLRYDDWEPDPELVQIEYLDGVTVPAGVKILQGYQSRDKLADLEWISQRVGGHALILQQLAAIGRKQPGYLRKHPEKVTRKIEPILEEQLNRQSEAAQVLLQKMCLLQTATDLQGLTFLRLYSDQLFPALQQASERNERLAFADEALEETEKIVKALVDSSLVQCQFDEERCEMLYSLHQLIEEFLQTLPVQLCDFFQQVDRFYKENPGSKRLKSPDETNVFALAVLFNLNVGNERELAALAEELMRRLLQWGHGSQVESQLMQNPAIANESDEVDALLGMGMFHRDLGNWDEAERLFQQALDIATTNHNSAGMATSWASLGYIENVRGNWDEAERLYRQCLAVEEELGDKSGMATSWASLGYIENVRGNWDEAERLYRQCLAVEEELGDKSGMATSWASLGYIENVRGNWDEAERLYRQSLALREELGDKSGMATSWGVLGDIERNRGNWDEAERLYRQCLAVEEELGDKSGMATSWGLLGDIERKRGNWDEAERLFRQSLALREELGDKSGMATSWGQLGDIERNRGNWDEAERLFRQCLAVEEELGDKSGMASSWGVLGDIERKRGNWDEAERLFRQSLALREELGDKSGMATSWGCLGETELGRGNLDQAETLLLEALEKMQELGMTWHIAETNFDLALLYRQRNDPDRAQQHYAIAHQLYTQLGAAKDLERIQQEW